MSGDRVRDEAERLVTAALAALSTSLRSNGGASGARDGGSAGSTETPGERGFATGSAECCVCPVCRTIAAMRDPNSDLADRLAAGVGDLVSGVTAILRTLSARGGRTEASPEQPTSDGDEFWENLRRKAADAAKAYGRPSTGDHSGSTMDDPWHVATRESEAEAEPSAAAEVLVPRPTVAKKTVAKKAAKTPVAQRTAADATDAGAEATQPQPPVANAVAKKAVAKKAVKKAVAPGGSA